MSVIVLLADGLRTDTLRAALDEGTLPGMAALRADGGLHEVVSTFPSVTGLAYAPFLMGRFPGSVGMVGLRWFDRARSACSFPDYTRSYVGYQMGRVNRDLDAGSPTIFELVPDSAAALSMITRGLPRRRQLAAFSARSALRAARTHYRGDLDAWIDVDCDVSRKLIARARIGDSRFLFAAFLGIDKASHARGHQDVSVMRALRVIDDTVGALRSDRSGAHQPHRIWVASDHGHSPVSNHDDLERVIRGMGLRVVAHPWVYRPAADVAVMVSGNAMAHVYVDLRRRQRPYLGGLSPCWHDLAEQLLRRESVDVLVMPLDASRCEVWSGARGRATITCADGTFSYHRNDGDPLRVGRDLRGASAAESYDATVFTDYPDSIVQIAALAGSPRSGDLILSAARGWDFRERYEPIPHVSSHGALHRDHMVVPLLLDRPPAKPPRRTTDVMPSALAALGVEIPADLEGESFG